MTVTTNDQVLALEAPIEMIRVTPTLYSVYAPFKGMAPYCVAERVTEKVAKSIVKVVGGEYRVCN